MFTVANAADCLIAKFHTMEKLNAWCARNLIIRENVSIRFNKDRVGETEWVMPGYQK